MDVGTVDQEGDHVVEHPAITTTPEVDTMIAKEMAREATKTMIVIRVMEVIVTEWNAALIRAVNAPTKATMVGVAIKATMASVTTRVLTDRLAVTEEATRMCHEETAVATVVVNPEVLREDPLEAVAVTTAETHLFLKSKEEGNAVKPESSHFVLK